MFTSITLPIFYSRRSKAIYELTTKRPPTPACPPQPAHQPRLLPLPPPPKKKTSPLPWPASVDSPVSRLCCSAGCRRRSGTRWIRLWRPGGRVGRSRETRVGCFRSGGMGILRGLRSDSMVVWMDELGLVCVHL